MSLHRERGTLGTKREKIPDVLVRSETMNTGFIDHAADYPGLNPPQPAFQGLIQNLVTSQKAVSSRVGGSAAARNVDRDLLWTAMWTACASVQTIADANPSRATSLILNAGLVLVGSSVHTKPLLGLKLGSLPGVVNCNANIGLLMGAGALKPHQQRFLSWQYTVDGGKTLVFAGSTPGCKFVITGLPPLTLVGVRVSLTTMSDIGGWSQMVTISTR